MANLRIKASVRNAMLQALLDAVDAGSGAAVLKVYGGSQPANADTAVTSQTLIATLTFSNPAGDVSAGVLTFDAITEDSDADAEAEATWARVLDSDGNVVFDADVGDEDDNDATIQMNTTAISAGGPFRVNSFVINLPANIVYSF